MWWKILIAIVCAVLLISPIDIFSGIQIDDIIYFLGLVASVLSAIKKRGITSGKDQNGNGGSYNGN